MGEPRCNLKDGNKAKLIFFKKRSDLEGIEVTMVMDGAVSVEDRVAIFARFDNGQIPVLAVHGRLHTGWRLRRTAASVDLSFVGEGWEPCEIVQCQSRLTSEVLVDIAGGDPEDRLP